MRALGLVALAVGARLSGESVHGRLTRWDAQWYAHIATHGYGLTKHMADGRHLSDLAFFPLFPVLERAAVSVTGLAAVDAGLVVGAAAGLVAAALLHDLGTRLYDARTGLLLVLLWAAVPVGIVESMAYSETLFTALAAGAVLAAVRHRWLLAGLLAALAGLTRPVGLAVVVGVVLAAALAVRRREDGLRPALGAALAPLGWLGYVAWVGARVGNPLGYFTVADGWGNSFDGGVAYARWVAGYLGGGRPGLLLGLLLVLATLAVVTLVVLGVRDRQPAALLGYTVVLVALAFTTSGYFGSKPRYLLPAFGLLLPVAVRLARARVVVRGSVIGLLVLGSAVYGAVWLLGPGPP
ncbi:MAG: hypothetical protein ACXVWU_01255 [Nocardioides sp.]